MTVKEMQEILKKCVSFVSGICNEEWRRFCIYGDEIGLSDGLQIEFNSRRDLATQNIEFTKVFIGILLPNGKTTVLYSENNAIDQMITDPLTTSDLVPHPSACNKTKH